MFKNSKIMVVHLSMYRGKPPIYFSIIVRHSPIKIFMIHNKKKKKKGYIYITSLLHPFF